MHNIMQVPGSVMIREVKPLVLRY